MIKLGLIGCGDLGSVHVQCVAQIEGAQFVAYADISQPAAERYLHQFGGSYATDDIHRVIADDQIDAIYICTRHDSHASLAIAAARAGRHIFCEKPLALDVKSCEQVAETIEKTGVCMMPGFKMRYYPLVREAKAFLPNPQVVVGQMMDYRWKDDYWAQDPVQGGGNVLSQGCHTVDLLRYFANSEPVAVWAAGGAMTHPGHQCIDQCVASIQFANGCVGSWIQGDAGRPELVSKFYFELFGHDRSVQLYDRLTRATLNEPSRTRNIHRDDEEGFRLENEAFIAALNNGHKAEQTVHDAVQVTRIVLAAQAAIRTGNVQTL